jgi:Domain of unknown function (DUF5666)
MKKYISIGSTALILAGAMSVAIPAMADTDNAPKKPQGIERPGMMRQGERPAVIGLVSAVNGNTIIVTGQNFGPGFASGARRGNDDKKTVATSTAYMVDITNAKVTRNNATSSASAITVGDRVMVLGTVTGINVVATVVRDDIMQGFDRERMKNQGRPNPVNPEFQGNGQPIVVGTISSITGSTLTITNKSNLTYSVDATNAKVTRGQNAITLAGVTVGDTVIIQGAVNGTSIVASSVMDQNVPAVKTATENGKANKGFFTGIGNFFSHLFGF